MNCGRGAVIIGFFTKSHFSRINDTDVSEEQGERFHQDIKII